MTDIRNSFEFTTHSDVLKNCTKLYVNDCEYKNHDLIKNFGSPDKEIYIDRAIVSVGKQKFNFPLVLPIFNGNLDLIQCAFLENGKKVQNFPESESKGFALYGEPQKKQPIIVVYGLEAFFKISQTKFPVVLVVLPTLCIKANQGLTSSDYLNVKSVIEQLSSCGYEKIFMPVRIEHINLNLFKKLSSETSVLLFSQSMRIDDFDSYCGFTQDEATSDVESFIQYAIENIADWKSIIPLQNRLSSLGLEYPIQQLPKLVKVAIEAIAEQVQAPISMAAQCIFGALSYLAQGSVNAPHYFNSSGEPCSLFLLTEGQSGSRKSTCRNLAEKTIIEYERKLYDSYQAQLKQWKNEFESLSKKDQAVFIKNMPSPKDPITRHSDVTVESIASLFIDGDIKNASIASDEAGQFFGGHTMKSDTRDHALGVYTKIFDNGNVERTRSKSNQNGSGRVYDARLTFSLQGQREVLSEMLKHPVLKGQGFLPRFLLAVPENLAGQRLHDAEYRDKLNKPDVRLTAYWERCTKLLVSSVENSTRQVLQMNEEAKRIDLEFYNEIEVLQARGNTYEYLQAFASRAAQLARRLATVLAYFEDLEEIDSYTYSAACAVVRHSLVEWSRYAEIETNKETDAQILLRFLVKKCINFKTELISKSKVSREIPNVLRKNGQFKNALEELVQTNHVREEMVDKTTYIRINPILLKKD